MRDGIFVPSAMNNDVLFPPGRRARTNGLHEEGVQPRKPAILARRAGTPDGAWIRGQDQEEGQGDLGVSGFYFLFDL